MELLDSTEKLVEAQSQITKLQTCVDSILKDRVQMLSGLDTDLLLFFTFLSSPC